MMRCRNLFILIFILCAVSLSAATEYYLQIEPVSRQQLEKLTRLVSIHKIEGSTVFAFASQKELDFLNQTDFSYRIIPGPFTGFETQMATTRGQMRDWDYYPTYEIYVDLMYQFAENHPEICEVFSIGSTIEGRELLVAHIGDDLTEDSDEPEFYYMGQIHGNEIVTNITLLHLIDDLLNLYGSDPRIDHIINEIDLYINPLANPDGLYAGGNNTVTGAIRYNANGVDLNRNFPDPEDGIHPDGNETQLENLLQIEFASQHNFVLSANYHAGTEVVNYPWDTWSTLHADDDWWQQVSHTYADAVQEVAPANYFNQFNDGITNGYQWYTISGGYQDYMNWYHYGRSVTIEISDIMALPANQLLDHYYWNYNSLLLLMEESLYGIKGYVTDSGGNPLNAKVTVMQHDNNHSEIFSNVNLGDYHRPIYEGIYELCYSAWGFEPQNIACVAAPLHDVTYIDVSLQPAAMAELRGTITDTESGLPIFGAWLDLTGTPLPEVMTNIDGNYTIADLPAGEYQLFIHAYGYSCIQEPVIISGGTNFQDYTLAPSAAISFENSVFPADYNFSSTGYADWFISDESAHEGLYSACSGDVDDHENTNLLLNVELVEDGSISFWKRVSSEGNYDFLRFYINNTLMGSWSGNVSWSEQNYELNAGENNFKWEYTKDTSVSSGADCAWIDEILITGLPETGIIYGDIDNNELVESYDASLVQRYVVEMNPGIAAPLPWQEWRIIRADVDANGYIEAYDASLILQYYVGIITQFPAE